MKNTEQQNSTETANCGNTMLAAGIFKPILFSTDMVKAILAGRKTQTRRICKHQYWQFHELVNFNHNKIHKSVDKDLQPRYQIGDTLWVRETWLRLDKNHIIETPFVYRANADADTEEIRKEYIKCGYPYHWKPSIFMPREAARIFLKVTRVRVERLQDIIENDARAEGLEDVRHLNQYDFEIFKDYLGKQDGWQSPINSFKSLWKSINGYASWDQNPWVFVYEFERTERPYA